MDVSKDGSPMKLLQTPESLPQRAHAPEIIGTWSLRNREQLRKRKAEAQQKQTSQWLLGGQKKRKYQRTGKGNPRGQKRQSIEAKAEPQSQTEKQRTQKVLEPAEEEPECPVNPETEGLSLVALPSRAVPEEHCSEAHQEGIQCQEIAIQNHSKAHKHRAKPEDLFPNTCQEIAVLQHSSKMCQDTVESEALSPEMCQETAVPQNHSSKVPQDMAGPKVFSPKMCQEPAGLQEHTLKMCQDAARPEDLSPKSHQEMAVVPWTTLGDAAGPEGHSPQSDVSLDTCPKSVTQEKTTSQVDQRAPVTEGCFSETQECTMSEDISTKTHQGAAEPELISHKSYKLTEPTVSSHKTIQDSLRPEEYSPEICQPIPGLENDSPEACHEMPGPEDLSLKPREKRDGPDGLPEQTREADGAQAQDPKAHQDSERACAFSQEMKEKAKGDQDTETSSSPQGPPEICPEDDTHGYALF